MHSTPEALADPAAEAAVGALEAAAAQIAKVPANTLSNADRLAMLQRLETVQRALPGIGLELVAQLDHHWRANEYATGSLAEVLADRLRITPLEARSRTRTADDLAHRSTLLGQVLPPLMPRTAAAVAAGAIGPTHVKVVRDFLHHLPSAVDATTRTRAEAQLAEYARELRPDQLRKVADRLDAILNPDGTFTDTDRARRRSFTLGPQGSDLMSTIKGTIDPETRAYLEAILAKYAKPGILNPDDTTPVTDGDPDPQARQRDPRSPAQRQHDALKAILRDAIASGRLGQHRGLPVSVIVSMTLKELEDALQQATPHETASNETASTATADTEATGTRAAGTRTTGTETVSTSAAGTETASTGTTRTETASTGAASTEMANTGAASTETASTRAAGTGATGRHHVPTGLDISGDCATSSIGTTSSRAVEISNISGPPVTTGGGTLLPIRDALRLAAHAHHYLALFDDHDARPLYLARTKRIATPDQRIVLHAKDIGCTFPGCTKPGYLCETHHSVEWATGGATDADQLTFTCPPHHRLAGTTTRHWTTRTAPPGHPHPGRTQWIPPTHIDPARRPRINRYHHPSEYLTPTPEPSASPG